MRLPVLALMLAGLGLAGAEAEADDPSTLYALNCMGCHQQHGEGHASVPELKEFVGNFVRVPGGREFLVQVPGVAQSGLADAEIAAVLNWTLREFSPEELPADFVPYDAAEVARYRSGRLVDVAPVRTRLIEEMRRLGVIE